MLWEVVKGMEWGWFASCPIWDQQRHQQTNLHSHYVPLLFFLITHTLPRSGTSGGIYFCLLTSSPYLVAFLEVFVLTVLCCHRSNFKNLACSKILSGKNKNQKNMVAIKSFDCVAASEGNCSLERGKSLWCPQYGSHRLKLPRTTTQPKGHLLDVLKYLERDAILLF